MLLKLLSNSLFSECVVNGQILVRQVLLKEDWESNPRPLVPEPTLDQHKSPPSASNWRNKETVINNFIASGISTAEPRSWLNIDNGSTETSSRVDGLTTASHGWTVSNYFCCCFFFFLGLLWRRSWQHLINCISEAATATTATTTTTTTTATTVTTTFVAATNFDWTCRTSDVKTF